MFPLTTPSTGQDKGPPRIAFALQPLQSTDLDRTGLAGTGGFVPAVGLRLAADPLAGASLINGVCRSWPSR